MLSTIHMTRNILHIMKKECEITISFLTMNYSNTHLKQKPNAFVCLLVCWSKAKQSKASFHFIWSESVFMETIEFANERIKMTFQMRDGRWTKVELYWQFMPKVRGVERLYYYTAYDDDGGYHSVPSLLCQNRFSGI